MISTTNSYCLDANVLIQAWQKYYAPDLCPDYWNKLNELGNQGLLFIPSIVREEITRTEDELSKWIKDCDIPIRNVTESVARKLQEIYSANPHHKQLVDNTKNRSLADPWVIAHALDQGATVVTKEVKIIQSSSKRIRIPNVCDNMGVRWIDDFNLVRELGIQFLIQ